MNKTAKCLVIAPATVLVCFFAMALVNLFIGGYGILGLLAGVAAAYFTARSLWQGLSGEVIDMRSAMTAGALLLGSLGFAGGFFGPMLLVPEANQGPLLGIFITGPLGFVAGAVAGWAYAWRSKVRRKPAAPVA